MRSATAHIVYVYTASKDVCVEWWLTSRKRVHKAFQKGFDTFVHLLSCFSGRKEVFDGKFLQAAQLADHIARVTSECVAAGFRHLTGFLQGAI
jgi:hypothetical protein